MNFIYSRFHLVLKLFLLAFGLLMGVLLYAQNIGDYRSLTSGEWTGSGTWEIFDGANWLTSPTYPGEFSGTYSVNIQYGHEVTIDSEISTEPMGILIIDGKLSLHGDNNGVNFYLNTQYIYVTPDLTPYATIEFNQKSNLWIPENAVILVWAGGLSGQCSNNQNIYQGTAKLAACNGAPGSIFTFAELMQHGGTLNSVVTTPYFVCFGDTVQLHGDYTGATGTPVVYSWKSTGVSPLKFLPDSTAKDPYVFPLAAGDYNVSLTVSTTKGTIVYSNTEKVILTVGFATYSDQTAVVCSSDLPYLWHGKSFTATGTYTDTLTNSVGCDSITILNLTINVPTSSETNLTVCNKELPLNWNGKTIAAAGIYTDTLINAAGCDSITTLNLTVNVPTSSETNATICSSDLPYTWHGTSFTATGIYTDTLTNSVDCDSITTLNLTVNVPTSSETNATTCSSDLPYLWHGKSFTATGTYTDTLINTVGCDSITTLDLTMNIPTSSETNLTVCNKELPLNWNGKIIAAAGIYTDTLINAAGCDSITTLNLTVNVPTSSQTNAIICSSDLPYLWHGKLFTTAGTYTDTLINVAGCDSITTLNLTVNVPTSSETNAIICSSDLPYLWHEKSFTATGIYTDTLINVAGCDSITTLNLTVNVPTSSETNLTVCNKELPLNWNGKTIAAAGIYTDTLINAAGCDSITTMNLTVNVPTSSETNLTVCNKELPLNWNGKTIAAAGIYTDTLINSVGCDSITTLNLMVNVPTSSQTNAIICSSDLPYLWHGKSFTAPGTYTDTLINAVGCDSITTLDLTVNVPTSSETNLTVCNKELPLNWNGKTIAAAGIYTDTLVNAAGCDSITTLNLTVNVPTSSQTNAIICSSDLPYLWHEKSFTITGTYTDTLINVAGCDSITTLNLTVNVPTSSETNATICSSDLPYLWHGKSFTITGTYTDTLINVAGCDSITTLNLIVNVPTSSQTNATICSSDLPYLWHGKLFTATGTYTDTLINAAGCDSITTLNLTVNVPTSSETNLTVCNKELPLNWNGKTIAAAGIYTDTLINSVGCDSITTLNLTVNVPTSSETNLTVCNKELPLNWNGKTIAAVG
ncbi:MAG: hypothetical protein PHH37_14975, partial [Paludibacter sp.]|nr:hypothetical protein [Paludibacter sp.]